MFQDSGSALGRKALLLCAVAATLSGQNIINTVAGNHTAGSSGDGGPAISAQISSAVFGLASDSAGNFYFGDYSNCRIRKVDSSGVISTVAGTGTCGSSGDGGVATSANIRWPLGLAVDSAGNLYFGEDGSPRVRRVTTGGTISTVAGTGVSGFTGDGGPATSATFGFPTGLAVDASGNLYISDLNNNRIRKVNTSGVISTFGGGGASLGDGGPATSATLNAPWGLSIDSAGNLYIAERGGNRIRKIDTSGVITTFAGTGTSGVTGEGGPATSARVSNPWSVSVDSVGNVYLAEGTAFRVRRVNSSGNIETVAGTGASGYSGDGGPAISATMTSILGINAAPNGTVYIADTSNNVIRALSAGRITALPATALGSTSAPTTVTFGLVTGLGVSASLVYGSEFAVNTAGCTYSSVPNFQATCPVTFTPLHVGLRRDALQITDGSSIVGIQYLYGVGQGPLAAVTPGTISTLNLGSVGAVTPAQFTFDPAGNLYFNEDPSGRIVKIDTAGVASEFTVTGLSPAVPLNLAADWAGNLFATDSTGRLIKIAPDGSFTTVASGLTLGSTVGQLAIGPNGDFYIADITNDRIVKVSLDGSTTSVLTVSSPLSSPGALTFDVAGNLYIANQGNSTIVKITPSGVSSVVTTSPAIQVPAGIWPDAAGNLYIVDAGTNKLFRVASDGTATVIAGTGTAGNTGDGGPATAADITAALVALDPDGSIYLADRTSNLIRKISPPSSVTFPDTTVGSSTLSTASLSNIGNLPYTLPSSFTFGSSPSAFSLVTGGTNDCLALLGGSFAPGTTCSATIQFSPAAAQNYTDTLTFLTGVQVPLTGLGVPALVGTGTLSTNTLSFGSVTNGSTSAPQVVTLSNTGTGTLNITSAVVGGANAADFALNNSCSATLSAGTSCNFSVTFQPSSTASETAALTITVADATTLIPVIETVTLSGTGAALAGSPSLSSANLTFASVAPGATSAAQILTLTNTGAAPLTVASVSLTGSDANEFTLTNSCGASLAASANCSLQIAFAPTSPGGKTANLVFSFTGPSATSTVALSGISTYAAATVPSGVIKILSFRSGKALDVMDGSTVDGAPIQQYDYLTGGNQMWEAIPVDATYYKIRNVKSGKVLDANSAGTKNGTRIQQWNYLGGDHQQWQFLAEPDGSFEIVNKLSGKALDVINLSTQNQARIQLWDYNATDNQKWQISAVTLAAPAVQYYTISSLASGKVLDVIGASSEDQARVQQYEYLGGANQQWQLLPTAGGYYQIVNRWSGKVLDAKNAVAPDGAPVQQYTYLGGDNQQWQPVATANGYYQIINKASGKSLDITGMSSESGALLQTYTYWGGANQQFELVPVRVP